MTFNPVKNAFISFPLNNSAMAIQSILRGREIVMSEGVKMADVIGSQDESLSPRRRGQEDDTPPRDECK